MKLLAPLASLVMANTALAAPILSENFDSLTAGNLAGQGQWTQNNAGTMLVVESPTTAFSTPNYFTLGNSGAVQQVFAPTDLTLQPTVLSFQFLAGSTAAAGRNIQLSLRTGASGSSNVFFLNLLGNRTSVMAGTSEGAATSFALGSTLAQNTWYTFTATTQPEDGTLTFNIGAASGGGPLLTQTIDLSGTSLETARLIFSSNAGTQAGDWAIDNVRFEAIPEPGTLALAIGGLGLLAFYQRKRRRASL